MKSVTEALRPVLYKIFKPLKVFPPLRGILRFGYYELIALMRLIEHKVRNIHSYRHNKSMGTRQTISTWQIANFEGKTYRDFLFFLQSHGINYVEGGHTIYIPPQINLDKVFRETNNAYPPDAGFKILKNFAPPENASYLDASHAWPRAEIKLMGSILQQVDSANALFALGLGPRLYDLAELYNDDHQLTCFVVQHIHGETPSINEYHTFLQRLQEAIDAGILELVAANGLKNEDFQDAPGCNGNLLKNKADAKLYYVDFQQFIPRNDRLLQQIVMASKNSFHFGKTYLFRGHTSYLYQKIPGQKYSGKRDTAYRWERIQQLLNSQHLTVKDRLVLDICCNAGIMMSAALRNGAKWCVGWDLPEVVSDAERLQAALGCGRLHFVGAQLSDKYSLKKDIPEWLMPEIENAIVFYLAAWQHIGLLEDLKNISWKALIFEGHEGETMETLKPIFEKISAAWEAELREWIEIADGDSGVRTMAIFTRR